MDECRNPVMFSFAPNKSGFGAALVVGEQVGTLLGYQIEDEVTISKAMNAIGRSGKAEWRAGPTK
jgi:hypothetical protein